MTTTNTDAPYTILDVSSNNGPVDWKRVSRAMLGTGSAVDMVAVKMTEGAVGYGSTDARGTENLAGSVGAGLPTIAYHFLSAWSEPEAQVAHFLAAIGGHLPQLAGLMLDVERGGGPEGHYAPGAFVPRFLDALHEAMATQGVSTDCVIYSAAYVSDAMGLEKLPEREALAAVPLWVAAYTAADPPVCPPWGAWGDPGGGVLAWQWTDKGAVDGVSGPCDLSRAKRTVG